MWGSSGLSAGGLPLDHLKSPQSLAKLSRERERLRHLLQKNACQIYRLVIGERHQ